MPEESSPSVTQTPVSFSAALPCDASMSRQQATALIGRPVCSRAVAQLGRMQVHVKDLQTLHPPVLSASPPRRLAASPPRRRARACFGPHPGASGLASPRRVLDGARERGGLLRPAQHVCPDLHALPRPYPARSDSRNLRMASKRPVSACVHAFPMHALLWILRRREMLSMCLKGGKGGRWTWMRTQLLVRCQNYMTVSFV